MPPAEAVAGRLWHAVRVAELVVPFVSGRSEATRDANPRVRWGKVVGTRHRPVHEYDGMDPRVLWRIAAGHVPTLLERVRPLIPPPPPNPLPQRG